MLSLLLVVLGTAGTARAQVERRQAVYGGFAYFRSPDPDAVTSTAEFFLPDHDLDTTQRGWIAGYEYRPFAHLSFVGEASGTYGGKAATSRDIPDATFLLTRTERTHLFVGGPRARVTLGRVTPFAHAELGVARRNGEQDFTFRVIVPGCHDVQCDPGIDPVFRSTDATSFATVFGGGVDVRVARRFSLRLLQADWVRTRFDDSRQNDTRLSAGLVIEF